MRVAFYTRISTDEDHQKYSLDAQRDRLDAYCISQYEEYKVVKVFRDASSGTNMNRAGLEEMLYAAENKLFEVLIVFRVDRLSRNVRQLAQMVETLTDYGVVLRSSTEPFDTSNSAGKMMLQMLGVFAEFEHATIVERTKAGMERKARNGEWCGGFVLYGYQKVDGEIFIEDEEAAIVRRIFRNYVHGKKGATKIFKELNEAGLRKRSGIMWENRAIINMLKNPFYTGVIKWNDSIFEGKHKGIISNEIFDKAQKILANRNKQSNGKRFSINSDFVLTGLIFCGRCGKGLVGRSAHRNGHRHRYYACANRSYHKGCDLPFIRADVVEELTMKELKSIFKNPELLDKIWKYVDAQLAEKLPDKDKEVKKIQADIESTKSALDRYFGAFEAGTLKAEVLRDKMEELNLKLQQLDEEKVNLDDQMEKLRLNVLDYSVIKEYVETFEIVMANGPNEKKKHLLKMLVEKVLVHNRDRFEFEFCLHDGASLNNTLKNIPDEADNALSVNHLADTVCNQVQLAPRMGHT
jgi:site-specific DNA recombinase